MFTIDLPKHIEKRLLLLAMTSGRTIQYCAREAILDYVEEVEEQCLARYCAESILAIRNQVDNGTDKIEGERQT